MYSITFDNVDDSSGLDTAAANSKQKQKNVNSDYKFIMPCTLFPKRTRL